MVIIKQIQTIPKNFKLLTAMVKCCFCYPGVSISWLGSHHNIFVGLFSSISVLSSPPLLTALPSVCSLLFERKSVLQLPNGKSGDNPSGTRLDCCTTTVFCLFVSPEILRCDRRTTIGAGSVRRVRGTTWDLMTGRAQPQICHKLVDWARQTAPGSFVWENSNYTEPVLDLSQLIRYIMSSSNINCPIRNFPSRFCENHLLVLSLCSCNTRKRKLRDIDWEER